MTAIVTSLVALIVGLGGLLVSLWTLRKTGVRAVAAFRQQWIDTLRKALTEYHSIMMTTELPLSPADDRKASDLGTQIELMLNPDEEASRKLEEVINEIDRCKTSDARVAMDPAFIATARRVLKQEWNRVKAELK
jgi:hypothetical protein